jgi:hypothetical protein
MILLSPNYVFLIVKAPAVSSLVPFLLEAGKKINSQFTCFQKIIKACFNNNISLKKCKVVPVFN